MVAHIRVHNKNKAPARQAQAVHIGRSQAHLARPRQHDHALLTKRHLQRARNGKCAVWRGILDDYNLPARRRRWQRGKGAVKHGHHERQVFSLIVHGQQHAVVNAAADAGRSQRRRRQSRRRHRPRARARTRRRASRRGRACRCRRRRRPPASWRGATRWRARACTHRCCSAARCTRSSATRRHGVRAHKVHARAALSVYLFICLFVCLFLSISLFVCLFVCFFVLFCFFVFLFFCFLFFLSTFLVPLRQHRRDADGTAHPRGGARAFFRAADWLRTFD